ncbi:hypothetical protein GM418_02495 [Maribellus comscasis]|uniref:Uncharacterized protein n=1 Tax=Maribellus comscasis TaxID=2681766 RepID=A0A6I6JNK2_9BACT|nr:hypothetical protein [Maribellus comscasis]QGY42560.1 hypothetical protein GM418_02495 [Maribellus comscasis]
MDRIWHNSVSPEYDLLNIITYLKEGEDTITVEVLSNIIETLQIPYSVGSFITR